MSDPLGCNVDSSIVCVVYCPVLLMSALCASDPLVCNVDDDDDDDCKLVA